MTESEFQGALIVSPALLKSITAMSKHRSHHNLGIIKVLLRCIAQRQPQRREGVKREKN